VAVFDQSDPPRKQSPVPISAAKRGRAKKDCAQTPDRARNEQNLRQAFLLSLSDALRPLIDPVEIQALALRLLGEHLGVDRAAYGTLESDDQTMSVVDEWKREGVPSVIGRYQIDEFGAFFTRPLREGGTSVIEDARSDSRVRRDTYEQTWGAIHTRSAIAHALVKGGRFVAAVFVHQEKPRAWTEAEIAIVAEVGERTWEAVERARAEQTLRVNEKRLLGQKEAFRAAIDGEPLEQSLGILARMVTEETAGAARTAFYVADRELTCLHPIPGGSMPESYKNLVDRFPIGHESLACGLALASNRPVLTRDVLEEPAWKPWINLAKDYDYRGCWSFPIETRDRKPIGTFAMYFREPRDASPHDIALADIVTQAAAIIISRHMEAEGRGQAEATLGESEERFRVLVENIHEYALIQTDSTGLVTMWNPGAQRLFGHSPAHMLGRSFSALLTAADVQRGVFRDELALITSEQRRERAGWLVRQDGTRFWARWIAEPVHDDSGQFRGLAVIIRDETEREEAEQQREALRRELERSNEDLSRFSYSLAHDLTGPTSSVRAIGDLLLSGEEGDLSAGQKHLTGMITTAAERMHRMVTSMLQLAQVGQGTLMRESISSREIIETVRISLDAAIRESQATIDYGTLPEILADRTQMERLFQNLISNSIQYRKPGKPPVISIWGASAEHGWIFAVHDNGQGIPPDLTERVFEPLRRLHGDEVPGTGLGLALCRRIVERHGGRIWAESPGVNQGTTILISLPRAAEVG
jgi:PAS domain S-box-containing protein